MSHESCSFEDLDPFERNECYYPKGGISYSMILKEDHGITDFSNATQVQDAITAGNAVIFGPHKAELPEPSVVEGENPIACGSETVVDGYDYTYEIIDMNVNANNDALMVQINSSQFSGLVMYLCEQDAVRVIEKKVSFNGRLVIPVSNKEKQRYLITAKWSQSVNDPLPVLYDAPAGIFE